MTKQYITIKSSGSILSVRSASTGIEIEIDHSITPDTDWPQIRDAAVEATGIDPFILDAHRRAWLNSRESGRPLRLVVTGIAE